MSRGNIIQEFLEGADTEQLDEYRANPLPLLEKTGTILTEKAEEIIMECYHDDEAHVAVEGARGTGKTFDISRALACRHVLKNDDIFHLGGSEEQAKAGFGYVTEFLYGHEELGDFMEEELKTAAKTRKGNWYKIAACSGTRVRGPHCGDPHREMGNVAHGGVCYTDEEAEIPDDIVDAVRFTINTAKPRKRIRSSTAHKSRGRFLQVANNPRKYGAKLIKLDIIDVVETCTHDCIRCPMGHYFAGPLLGGKAVRNTPGAQLKFQGRAVPPIPLPTTESIAAWEQWKERNQFPAHEPAMCMGRAKLHRPGHKSMDSLFQDIRESQSRASDDQEMFCRRRQGGNLVLNGAALEMCLDWDARYIAGAGECWFTTDWGWNWTVLIAWQEQNCRVVPEEVYYLKHMRIGKVIDLMEEVGERLGIYQVYADSSHKHENAEVAAAGFEVTEVMFSQWKDFGVRWLTGLSERRELAVPGRIIEAAEAVGAEGKYEFRTDGHRQLFEQLLGWKTGTDGKIVKQNDHGPDSTICSSVRFHGDNGKVEVKAASAGRRRSREMWER